MKVSFEHVSRTVTSCHHLPVAANPTLNEVLGFALLEPNGSNTINHSILFQDKFLEASIGDRPTFAPILYRILEQEIGFALSHELGLGFCVALNQLAELFLLVPLPEEIVEMTQRRPRLFAQPPFPFSCLQTLYVSRLVAAVRRHVPDFQVTSAGEVSGGKQAAYRENLDLEELVDAKAFPS